MTISNIAGVIVLSCPFLAILYALTDKIRCKLSPKYASGATQRKRKLLRRFHRPNRQPNHPALQHLTQEQWNTHKAAWADRCYGVGKYTNHSSIAEWIETEGLPPTSPAILEALEREYAAYKAYIAALPRPLLVARAPKVYG